MKNLSTIFAAASGTFGIIPGLAILITNIGVPPNTSKELFAAVIEVLGVITLIILWLNKTWIESYPLQRFNRLVLISTFLFVASLFSYLFIYGYLVEEVPNSNALFFPFWAKGELQAGLNQFEGNRSVLINEWGRDDVYKIINSSSKTSLLYTMLVLLFIYQLVFVSLTFCFGILGIRVAKVESEGKNLVPLMSLLFKMPIN